ncbi:MAG: hypothetical protein HFJ48_03735 [Clostridia bacterium]|nr:hypothetical protein [Clostridia bacterium]
MENNNENRNEISDLLKRDGVLNTIEEDTSEVQEVKRYKLRKLSSKDISPMIKILKNIDLKRLKNVFSNIDLSEYLNLKNNAEMKETEIESEDIKAEEKSKSSAIMKIGGTIVLEAIPMILDAIDNSIDDFNKLLANVTNVELEEIENLELDTYFNLVYDFINKEEFVGFIKVVSRFVK